MLFSSLYPNGLKHFFDIFQEKPEFFRKTLKQISMQNFISLASTQTNLAKFLTFIPENFKKFQKNIQRIS
jgi:hypothetical protein